MTEFQVALSIVFLFSIIQSVIGIGLLMMERLHFVDGFCIRIAFDSLRVPSGCCRSLTKRNSLSEALSRHARRRHDHIVTVHRGWH